MRILGTWLLVLAVALSGCAAFEAMTPTQKGAAAGTLLGAGTGALIGSQMEHPIAGTAIGAGIGMLGGGLIGRGFQGAQQPQLVKFCPVDGKEWAAE